jgi:HAD superfamily hydrolase (TIGR01450 family)
MKKSRAASVSKAVLARLERTRGFVLDLDGTMVLGDAKNRGMRALPGAREFVAHLRKRGVPFAALTNNTIRTPDDIAHELAAAGFDLAPAEIVTPSTVAAEYLAAKKFKTVMVMGHEGATVPLGHAGLAVVKPEKGAAADAVFVAWFRDVRMDHIDAACDAVLSGARLFAGSLAPYFATAGGRTLGTSCAIAGAITAVTGVRSKVLGKPGREALVSAARRMGLKVRDVAVIGDDPHLEIPMAQAGGALAVGVTTGVSTARDFARAKGKPAHLVVDGIGEFLRLYSRSA